jgi:hypothetical protein
MECSSRIPYPDFYPSRIQGSKRHHIPDPGSATLVILYLHVCLRCVRTYALCSLKFEAPHLYAFQWWSFLFLLLVCRGRCNFVVALLRVWKPRGDGQ